MLPAKATALVNHRIHPKDSVAKVIAHDVKTINDPRVQVEVFGSPVEPAPVSSVDTKVCGHTDRASFWCFYLCVAFTYQTRLRPLCVCLFCVFLFFLT